MPFRVNKHFLDDIIEHARAEVPNECCGLLAGAGDEVAAVYRTANAEASPTRYSLRPQELYQALKDIDARGWDLIGVYHSHTHSEAYPSSTDKRLAFWPDSRYVIVSLSDAATPVVRAFRIVEGNVSEETIQVVNDEAGRGWGLGPV